MTSVIILGITIGTIAAALLAILVYLLAIGAQSDGVDRTSKVERYDMPTKPAGYVSPKGGR